MDNFFGRFKNVVFLAAIVFAQVIGLALQVKRASQEGDTRLIRVWAVGSVTPLEKGIVHAQHWVRGLWSNYLFLHNVRQENADLRRQIDQMKLDDVRLNEDAQMARRVQALLAFKEQYIDTTVAAQVIGTSGSEQSRILYIDKGSNDGIHNDMAVITPTGIVGKVVQVFGDSAQVLPINDQLSGVGAALKDSRLQGILKGAPNGATTLQYIMSDEKVTPGEEVITSGGDHIFPKGLPVGKVVEVQPGKDLFLNIRVIPAARLDQLEEVLVVTKMVEKPPDTKDLRPIRASDILAERLPSVPTKAQAVDAAGNPVTANGPTGTTAVGATNAASPAAGAAGGTARAPGVAGNATRPAATTAGAVAAGATAAGAVKSLNSTANGVGTGTRNGALTMATGATRTGTGTSAATGSAAAATTRTGAGTSATTGATANGVVRNPAGTSANAVAAKTAVNPGARLATTEDTASANGATAGSETQPAVTPADTSGPATSAETGAPSPSTATQPTTSKVVPRPPVKSAADSAVSATTQPTTAKPVPRPPVKTAADGTANPTTQPTTSKVVPRPPVKSAVDGTANATTQPTTRRPVPRPPDRSAANSATATTPGNSAAKSTTGTTSPSGTANGASNSANGATTTTTRPAVVKRIVPPPGPDEPLNGAPSKTTPAAKSTQPAANTDGAQPQP